MQMVSTWAHRDGPVPGPESDDLDKLTALAASYNDFSALDLTCKPLTSIAFPFTFQAA